jgi:predicted O-linked N-acetylglucosamine transferase (SPINDLY family)
MASGTEIRTAQKDKLFDLLILKKDMKNENPGICLKALNRMITKTKAAMEAEDVAYVEKMIAEEAE